MDVSSRIITSFINDGEGHPRLTWKREVTIIRTETFKGTRYSILVITVYGEGLSSIFSEVYQGVRD